MTTTVNYYAETPIVINIHNHPIENIVLKNAIRSLDIGIITISFGSVLDQTYSNVITTHVRFAKENIPIYLEENLRAVKI
ncbi:MAG: hypothetical protein M3M84_07980 [Thermoproteota archaeon]|nr:hypothetical protein [Thermoproteota archaeon]